MTTRRAFLATLFAASTLPALSWADAKSPAYLGAARDADGAFSLYGLTKDGADLFKIPLPDRGHAAVVHPKAPEAVAFARRPGTFALVINCATGRVAHRLEAPEGRHFYGHGSFIAGGDLLCTTENDYATGEGRIGLWARREGYRRFGEIASGGVGPHDLLALEGDVLAVANGGLRTHPDQGRDKLNLDTMAPNLTYLTADGKTLETVTLEPDLHQNSIRHLARGPQGQVAFAMQWQGDTATPVPLLGLHKRGAAPVLAEADLAEQIAMEGYAGSIAWSGDGQEIAISSPRGGRVHVFDANGTFLTRHLRADICGLATANQGFVASDGTGGFWTLKDRLSPGSSHAKRAWDNHLIKVEA
ncbi:DUF1513 domain-containing protein [Paracoccaceae bacterium GXU_MW_L88]